MGRRRRLAGSRRPTVVTVLAEHADIDPVWDDSPVPRAGGPVELAALGVSPDLVARLRAWNEQYQRLASTDFAWDSPAVEEAWRRRGLLLACELQHQLWDVEVHYRDHHPEQHLPVLERTR